MNGVDGWGLFSPQAESMLQSVLGMQAYNSIRALDWLEQLPDVDPSRIAVTGASGGGTQTFILGAIDPRPAVLIPAVMVSTAMQGGCTCENASLLRVGTGNVEFAGLIAPRPLCLIAADDWTREMETKGFPELQALYQQLGVADRVELHPYLQFGHNYNYVSRAALYDFIQRRFHLDCPLPVVEQEFTRLTAEDLSVWDEQHPRPDSGPDVEREVLRKWTQDAAEQLKAARPRDAASLAAYRALVQPAGQAIFSRHLPGAGEVSFEPLADTPIEGGQLMTGRVRYRPTHQDGGLPEQFEELPVAAVFPFDYDHKIAAIWLDEAGKSGLLRDGKPRPEVAKLVQQGIAVVGVDLVEQGEHRSSDMPLTQTRRVDNDREAACYTLGYNSSLFAQRVQDVLTLLSFAVHNDQSPDQLYLIGLGNAGPWAAAARAMAGEHVDRAIIDTRGFRFLQVNDVRDPRLLPGAAKYDDLPGLLALGAPGHLVLIGETGDSAQLVRDAYAAAKATSRLVFGQADQDPVELLLHSSP